MTMKRTAFLLSDRTGISAETMGHSLITQFPDIEFETVTIPYIDTEIKARKVVTQINTFHEEKKEKPLIFSTMVRPDLRAIIAESSGMLMDFFENFIHPLEKELGTRSSQAMGASHDMATNFQSYKTRIDAINYALISDDGTNIRHYDQADVIVVGVSRSGKTPTCLYLALQFGIFAANYPFTDDDGFDNLQLPDFLKPHKEKIFGLTIDPDRLHAIRSERRANSPYAALTKCQQEIKATEQLYQQEGIQMLSSTDHSIEELSTKMLDMLGIKRRLH
tara:strand:+ start:20929 stop:21759 length:831 start_codon:yes stop_codon:yes gene_type:complete